MFDPSVEPPITYAQVRHVKWLRKLPRRGDGDLQNSTVIRWMLNGLRAESGQSVKLEHIRIGGTLCTSEAALRLADPATPGTSPTRGRKAHARAEKELAEAGF